MQAKALAHQRGSSISALVEAGLQNLANNADLKGASFTDKWMGKLTLAPTNPADLKRERLMQKYKLV